MFTNMKVALRLAVLAGALVFLMIVIGILGIKGMHDSHQGMHTVYVDRVEPMRDLKTVIDNFALMLVDIPQKTAKGMLSPAEAIQMTEQTLPATDALWDYYLTTFLIEDEKKLIKTAAPLIDQTRQQLRILSLIHI